MAFNKVVKAPAKLAHIGNCPRKKTEAKDRRVERLLDYTKSLLEVVLLNKGELKMYFYEQLRATEQELKKLGCYNSRDIRCMIREIRLYNLW